MPKSFKTASSRIETPLYEAFEKVCEKKGCSIHTDLKNYIEKAVKPPEKTLNVGRKLEKNGREIREPTENNSSGIETPGDWFW